MRYGLVLIGVGPPSRAIKACPSDGLEPHSVVATTVMSYRKGCHRGSLRISLRIRVICVRWSWRLHEVGQNTQSA